MNKRRSDTIGAVASVFCMMSATQAFAQESPQDEGKNSAAHIETSMLEQQAKTKIGSFSSALKQALVGATQSGGITSAVKVCKDEAPKIGEAVSTDGWRVARTSLKTRNANNAASEWEQNMLKLFDTQFKQGVSPNLLNTSIVSGDTFRYMQAIPTGQLCLACHGSQVDVSVLDAINTHYPQDKATGYTLQDIRGAFTLRYSPETE